MPVRLLLCKISPVRLDVRYVRCFLQFHTFDCEKATFCPYAAIGGEAAHLSVRRDHPVAWHDERKRVSRKRLPDRARRALRADLLRQRAIGRSRAVPKFSRGIVDAALKPRPGIH